MTHPYAGRIAGLATKHQKVPLVGPAMFSRLGLLVVEARVDTDALGTFTGEVPRVGSPLEVAVRKARLGMAHSGLTLGLASEGSFGPHESVPFLVSEMELLVLVDDERGIVVGEVEVEVGPPSVHAEVVDDRIDPTALARAGFPEHGLVVRPKDAPEPIVKGIHDAAVLRDAIGRCLERSPVAVVESDFRAHHHPTRRTVIARAARRLADRLAALCPECGAPGWGVVKVDAGAPCSWCRQPTRLAAVEHSGCVRCDHHASRPVAPDGGVDPAVCAMCNP